MVLVYKAMNFVGEVSAQLPLQKINPNVKPNSNAPMVKTLQELAGIVVFIAVIALVVALVIGAVMWAFGKIQGNGRAQDVGVTVLMWTLIAAAVVGSATGLITWSTGLNLGL